ncbi:MAG: hypothetical protein EHM81_01630 [Chloroflexi bacterium]|nr:MAG: hypothetical protein EHM81_01630 [Chloroflexota bacterium]
MISAPDFIKLPYSPELTEGGIAYATRSLPYTYDRMGGSLYSRLRRIVGGVAVELAFRRYLSEQGVPFDVKGATPFSEPDRYDVSLGGHRCDIKTFVTSKRNQITAMRRNPGLVLRAPAMIPEDQFLAVNHTDQDFYLFAFLLGLTTNSPEDIQKAVSAGQRIYLIHPLRSDWSRPQAWAPLHKLSLKSECSQPIKVEIGGQDAERNFITETLTLAPLTRVLPKNTYHSLAYIHTDSIPDARVGIHSPAKADIYLIQPHEWGNIWIYGMEIWLTGYMMHNEFRRKASAILAGSRVFQYSTTQAKNLSVPVADLRSLSDLFERVKEWEEAKKAW